MNHEEIANKIYSDEKKIILIYAFNTTGKTRLSVSYKDITKTEENKHSGVYYNAFSEDLFVWDNDIENNEEDIKLMITQSSLNKYHSSITEDAIREKLEPYKFGFNFSFNLFDDPEKGIESISFFIKDDEEQKSIKISRSEERIFIWCFFLALFEVEELGDTQNEHFFIDDPVSSLDDHNIFITALSIMKLIDDYAGERKIIITTHHMGFFSMLDHWLTRGEKRYKYENHYELFVLSKDEDGSLSLDNPKKSVFLYHLYLLQVLNKAKKEEKLGASHLVLLRQVLENIASFLGSGRFSYVLEQIDLEDVNDLSNRINVLSHKNIFTYESELIAENNKKLIEEILEKLQKKYKFVLHEPKEEAE